MSNQAKPYEELSEFNRDNFPSSSSSASSLDYPVAQGVASLVYGVIWGDGTYQNSASGGGGSALTVQDGAVTVNNVTDINVTNGTLTDNGGGSVSITTGGGGGGVTNPMTADLDGGNFSITNVNTYSGINGTFGEVNTETINDCAAPTFTNMGPVVPSTTYIVANIPTPPDAEGSIYVVSRCLDPGFKQTIVLQCTGFQNQGVINVISSQQESDNSIFYNAIYGTDGVTNMLCLQTGPIPSNTWEIRVYTNEDDKGTAPPYGSFFVPAATATPVVLTTKFAEITVVRRGGTTQNSQAANFYTDSVENLTAGGDLNLGADGVVTIAASDNVNIVTDATQGVYVGNSVPQGILLQNDKGTGMELRSVLDTPIKIIPNYNPGSTAGELQLSGNVRMVLPPINTSITTKRILDLDDPVDPQDAATKSYVDSSIPTGFVTNPMTSDLNGGTFDIDNVAILNETNNTQIGPSASVTTQSTNIYANVIQLQAKGQSAMIPINPTTGSLPSQPMLALTNYTKSNSATDIGNILRINYLSTSTGSTTGNAYNLQCESSHEYHRMDALGEMMFRTNPTFSPGPSLQNSYDSCIKIQRSPSAIPAPVINNIHYNWSEAGTTFGAPAYDYLCYGSSSQAQNPATDTPALIIDTFQKRVGVGVFPTEDFEIDGNMQIDSGSGTNSIKFYDSAGAHDHAQITAEDDGADGGQFKIKTKQDGGSLRDGLIVGQDLTVTVPGDLVINGTFSAGALEATNGGLTLPPSSGPGLFFRLLNGLQFPEPLWGETNVTESYAATGANYPKVNVDSPGISTNGPFALLSGAVGSNMTIDIPAQLNNCFFNITCYGTWNGRTDGGDGDATLFLRDDLNPAGPIYCLTTGNVVVTNNAVRYVVTMNCDVRLQQGTYAIFAGHHFTNPSPLTRTFTGTVRVTFSRGEV